MNKQIDNFQYDSNPFTLGFRGFTSMLNFAKTVTIVMIVLGAFYGVFNFFSGFFDLSNGFETDDNTSLVENKDTGKLEFDGKEINSEQIGAIVAIVVAVVLGAIVVGITIGTLVNSFVSGVVAASANSAANEKELSFSDAVNQAAGKFGTLYVATLVAYLKIFGGYLLFIIPGIRAQFRYANLSNVIMAEDVKASQALSRTKELNKGHLLEIYGIKTAASLIPFIGSVMSAGALAYSYKQVSYYKANSLPKPPVHFLNFLGFILAGLVVLFIGFMFALLLAAFAATGAN